jgi:hypothetical protein
MVKGDSLMGVVKATIINKQDPKYRFRVGWFSRQVLQVGYYAQDWDTNTGLNIGPEYIDWQDANKYEAETFLYGRGKI